MSFDRLLTKQEDLGARIIRFRTNLKKLRQEKLTVGTYETRLQLLNDYWAKFNAGHSELLEHQEYQNSNYAKEDYFDTVQEAFLNTQTVISDHLRELAGHEKPKLPEACTKDATVRLPKLSLPTFSGDYLQWETFRDLFTSAVHNATGLSNAARLQYLKSLLTGEAAKLVSGIPITDAQYDGAWKALLERYDDKELLLSHYLQQVLDLKPMASESSSELKRLLDSTTEIRRSLENLGRPVQYWDDWFIHHTVQKLDRRIRKDWETRPRMDKTTPIFADLQCFLQIRARALDAIGTPTPAQSTSHRAAVPQRSHFRAHATNTRTMLPCPDCAICSEKHYIGRCPEFRAKSPSERREAIKHHHLCFNCLRNHAASTCGSTSRCQQCGSAHHTLLHGSEEVPSGRPLESACAQTEVSRLNQPVLLATARVQIAAANGRRARVRVLLDQGSEASFISEELTQRLGLPRVKVQVPIVGMGAAACGTARALVKVTLSSVLDGYPGSVEVTALVLPRLVKAFRPPKLTLRRWPHIASLQLADPDMTVPTAVDLVLGADVYGQLLLDGLVQGDPGTPVAQNTIFGWVLSGRVGESSHSPPPRLRSTFHCSLDLSILEELRKFWELEEVVKSPILTPEEQECEEHFKRTHTRTPEGRFVVRLPRRSGVNLGDSRSMALRSFHHNEARRQKDETLDQAYRDFITEYQQLGHMALIDKPHTPVTETFYLPHHAVWKMEGISRKIRVVFNASARTSSGHSLNDTLLPGPTLQQHLMGVLLRWRKHKIAFSADIVKMFRQIWVHPQDQALQRILWRKSPEQELKEFQLKTVTYGTACAPYLAIRCLRQLATEEANRFPEASEVVCNQTYVDDVLTGADTVEHAAALKEQLQELLMAGGFQLAKWSSNSPQLVEENQNRIHYLSEDSVKTLGLQWHPDSDYFKFQVSLEQPKQLTKRNVLSCIAKLFDPLGWLAPVLITAKIFIQDLWTEKSGWDTPLSARLQDDWREYYQRLELLQHLRIPRWIRYRPHSSWELHGFCDASERAYAAAVYIRIAESAASYSSHLLIAKTKVAPVKVVSLPRLELCGAALLARLLQQVQETFGEPFKIHAWTDSQVVLCWLRAHPSKWKCFVANRTSEIHRLVPSAIWNHVSSGENAADPASRGLPIRDLLENRLWWHGPPWLSQRPSDWPTSSTENNSPAVAQEEERTRSSSVTTNLVQKDIPWDLQERYSSLRRLVTITAWLFRFADNVRMSRADRVVEPLTTSELRRSRHFWIKHSQKEFFHQDIQCLSLKRSLPKGSPLFRLRPFLDPDGFLRVGGRLGNAALSFEERHPLILSARATFTRLLVQDAHERTLHGGPKLILGYLGTHYWIIRGRNLARQLVHKCLRCFRQSAGGETQLMGQLPAARVTPSRPFLHTGVDYAGPIMLRTSRGRGHKSYRGYIALFVCLSTKAIHLEVVSDLTSEAFLAAFRRFTSRRGLPTDMYSDQGTTFQGGRRELQELFDAASKARQELTSLLAHDGTQWHFIPPRSPHFGGLWEAGVKSVKYHLRRTIGETTLTYEELTTLLSQIEACLNSRPLTPLSDSPEDFTALTPGHFLIGGPLNASPEPSVLDANPNRLTRWKLLQNFQQHFWKRWTTEYLHNLRQYPAWAHQRDNLQVGDLVLLIDSGLPPTKWHIGRITATHPGPDQLVRVVQVRSPLGEFTRPIVKVAKLPSQ